MMKMPIEGQEIRLKSLKTFGPLIHESREYPSIRISFRPLSNLEQIPMRFLLVKSAPGPPGSVYVSALLDTHSNVNIISSRDFHDICGAANLNIDNLPSKQINEYFGRQVLVTLHVQGAAESIVRFPFLVSPNWKKPPLICWSALKRIHHFLLWHKHVTVCIPKLP